jgi:hypothetical protein
MSLNHTRHGTEEAAQGLSGEQATLDPDAPAKSPRMDALRAWLRTRPIFPAVILYLLLNLILYHDLLLSPDRVISPLGSDIFLGELSGRVWALSELRHGHLPLWNPYNFSGTPFFTQSQVPLLYPGEWMGLYLPANQLINQSLALHTFLAGLFVFLWARARRLGYFGALTAGALYMFCGPFFMHIYGGQVNDVRAMAWTPLMFLAVDQILAGEPRLAGETRKGFLLGIFAFSMQLYASQPQSSYFSLIALLLYLAIRLPRLQHAPFKLAVCVVACAWALAIGALEMIPTVIQAGESIRSGFKTTMVFARGQSLPPENLPTLIMPGFLGDMKSVGYFGRWFIWSANLYFGIAGTTLAACGIFLSRRADRRVCIAMTAILLVLALGGYTPLYPFLYHYVPGISMFRDMSKFAIIMMTFVSLLAGMGLDALLQGHRRTGLAGAIAGVVGVGLLIASRWVIADGSLGTTGHWGHFLRSISIFYENNSFHMADVPAAVIRESRCAGGQMLHAGLMFLLAAVILAAARRRRHAAILLAVVGIVELSVFTRAYRYSFSVGWLATPGLEAEIRQKIGDDRVLVEYNPNSALMLRAPSIGGYGSFRLRRNAEFLAFTRNYDLDDSRYLLVYPSAQHTLLRLLRLKYAVPNQWGPIRPVYGPPDVTPLPHVLLVDQVHLMAGRETILHAMMDPKFDPWRQVILEEQPNITPLAGSDPAGTVRITSQTSDYLDITADLSRPAVLLVTDAYSKYWTVTSHRGNAQADYQVLPADYTLRAVPLAAGHHEIRLQYVAPAWKASEAVTCLALLAFLAYAGLSLKKTSKSAEGGRQGG